MPTLNGRRTFQSQLIRIYLNQMFLAIYMSNAIRCALGFARLML